VKKKKIWIGGAVIIVVVILGAVSVWSNWGSWWQRYQANKILREYATLDEAYRNDNYGSTTPEGTLVLFVDALKQGDADLASKYFVVEKREMMKKELSAGLKSGGVKTLTDIVSRDKKGYLASVNLFVFDTFDEKNNAEFSFRLLKNEYSQKWLIESL